MPSFEIKRKGARTQEKGVAFASSGDTPSVGFRASVLLFLKIVQSLVTFTWQ
jgi:hypothetical protein